MNHKRILVIEHMPVQNPGIFFDCSEEFGVEFDEVDLVEGAPIPDIGQYDALWIMGASMDVWEETKYPWLKAEKTVVRDAVTREMPFLGICFGHQILAEALGGTVEPLAQPEIGLVPVEPVDGIAHHPLFAGLPTSTHWVSAHFSEVVTAPENARILAASSSCNNHVMSVGEYAYSVQFHPEVCSTTMSGWMTIPELPEILETRIGSDALNAFKQSMAARMPELNRNAHILFRNWYGLVFA